MAQTKDEANVDVDMISDKLDNLTYTVDKNINLLVNQFNLASGEDNVTDTSTATVSFIANQKSKSAEAYYNIYFYIERNPYIYTTEDKKAEIILNIYDINNNEVTSIEGLDYVSAENANGETINGFDITEKAGLYTVSLNTKITSNSSITARKQTWKVKLTFVNLTSNQVANEDKQLTARMILNDKVYKKITEVYQNEIVNPAVSIIHEAKIGLMYVSDYAYSAIPINWFSILYNYNSTSQLKLNWLYSSTSEWLITRNSIDTRIAIHLSITTITRNDIRNPYAIRPTFSLISSTNYKSGNGTQNDPIIIE